VPLECQRRLRDILSQRGELDYSQQLQLVSPPVSIESNHSKPASNPTADVDGYGQSSGGLPVGGPPSPGFSAGPPSFRPPRPLPPADGKNITTTTQLPNSEEVFGSVHIMPPALTPPSAATTATVSTAGSAEEYGGRSEKLGIDRPLDPPSSDLLPFNGSRQEGILGPPSSTLLPPPPRFTSTTTRSPSVLYEDTAPQVVTSTVLSAPSPSSKPSDPYGDPAYNLFNATTTTTSTTSTTIAVHYPNMPQTPRPLAINPYAAVHQPASVAKVEGNSVSGHDLDGGTEQQVAIFGPPMRAESEAISYGHVVGANGIEAPARAAGTTTKQKGFVANENGKREQPKHETSWWTWKQLAEHTKKPIYAQSLRLGVILIPNYVNVL
jgi:hypothetical protein